MDAWLSRMLERHGARYVLVSLAVVIAEVALLIVPVCVIFPSYYLENSVEDYLEVVLIADGVFAAGTVGALLIVRRSLTSFLRWTADSMGEPAPRDVEFAFDAPRRIIAAVGAIAAMLVPLMLVSLAEPGGYTSTLDYIGLSIGGASALLISMLSGYFTLELLFRPIRAAAIGVGRGAPQSSRLTTRVVLPLVTMTWAGALAVGYMTSDRAIDGADHLLVMYSIALLATAIAAVVLAPLVAGVLLGPIGDLTRATRAVAAGDLDVRVRVASTDELGQLAESFNEMVVGLRERDALRGELEASRARIVTTADAERRRMERDLHDGAQQYLVLMQVKLGALGRRLDDDPAGARILAEELRTDAARAQAALRDLAHGIYPASLESAGLGAALREAAERAAVSTHVDCDGTGRYPPQIEAAVYFCCLEALQNVAKHAGNGATATVTLAERTGHLRFAVVDDGRGFAGDRTGHGLQSMRDRVGALGGELDVESVEGVGTAVRGSVPVAAPT